MMIRQGIFCVMLALLTFTGTVQAQSAADERALYERAVDVIDCETIKFIHREVGRDKIADYMDCSSHESVMKTIPIDETRTTGKLSDDISAYRSRYKEGEPLDAQIDKVIAFAYGRVTVRKRKNSVAIFRQKLLDHKAEVLALAQESTEVMSAAAGDEEGVAEETEAEASAEDEPGMPGIDLGEEEAPAKGANAGLLNWISLLLSGLALGMSIVLYIRSGKAGRGNEGGSTSNTIRDSKVHDLEEEIIRLRAQVTNLMVRTDQINTDKNEELSLYSGSKNDDTVVDEEPSTETGDNSYSYSPYRTEAAAEEPAETETSAIDEDEEEFRPQQEIKAEEEEQREYASDDIEEEENEEYDPAPTPAPVASAVHEPVKETQTATAAAIERTATAMQETVTQERSRDFEEAEGESLPFYKYAGKLQGQGFIDGALTEVPGTDSVYEVELYEDVPDKAFFSLLPYPEVVKNALENPDIYLKPCCEYTDDPAGKKVIVLEEEGLLRKEGDSWRIYQKARIRFE